MGSRLRKWKERFSILLLMPETSYSERHQRNLLRNVLMFSVLYQIASISVILSNPLHLFPEQFMRIKSYSKQIHHIYEIFSLRLRKIGKHSWKGIGMYVSIDSLYSNIPQFRMYSRIRLNVMRRIDISLSMSRGNE